MQKEAESREGMSHSRRQREVLNEQSLAEWSLFLEEMRGDDGAMVEDLHPGLTFGPVQKLSLGVPRL